MTENQKIISDGGIIVLLFVIANVINIKNGFIVHKDWYWLLLITLPLQLISMIAHRRNMY